MAWLVILSWFGIGLLSTLLVIICDLRGARYNENYIQDFSWLICLLIVFGWFSLIIALLIMFESIHIGKKISRKIYAILYKIANIGKDSNE